MEALSLARAAAEARRFARELYEYANRIDREAYAPGNPWVSAKRLKASEVAEAARRLMEAAEALGRLAEELERELPRLALRELAEARARELLEQARAELERQPGVNGKEGEVARVVEQ